jgi:glutaredoxin
MSIAGITDGPEAPTADMPLIQSTGPRFDQPPQRPKEGGSTFLVVKTDTCVWCKKTMDFLQALHEHRGDFQVAVMDASAQRQAFQQLTQHTRRTTVPQIFLDGRLVGGWDELAVAAKKGKLDAYLDGEDWQTAAPEKKAWWSRKHSSSAQE